MPYFWVSKEEEEEWAQSGMSIAEWKKLKTEELIRAKELEEDRLPTNSLWPAVQHWLPSIFPMMNRENYKVEFGYGADLSHEGSFQAVLSLYMPSGPETFDWELHVSSLGGLIGRPVTIKELSAQMSSEGPKPQVRGKDLTGTLRTAADVERLATALASLRWPKPFT